MDLRSIIQRTWTTGLIIFGMLVYRDKSKTTEVVESISEEEKTTPEE